MTTLPAAAPAPTYTAKVHEYGDFKVDEFITAADFRMVDFNKNDLDDAFSKNTGVISYIGHMLGRAKRQCANMKTRRDAVKAKLSKEIRDQMVKDSKKPTEASIDAEMRVKREFLEVSFAENHAIEIEQTIEALYWAARGRRNDMQYFADKQAAELQTKNYSLGRRPGGE